MEKWLNKSFNMEKSKIVSKEFLFAIYFCYAILGLCAPVVTSIWPEIAKEIAVDISLLGVVVTLSCIASGISSFFAFKVRLKLGTNYTNILGLVFFAISMTMFIYIKNYFMVIISMIILGLGNGLIDVNSNSYVVKAYDVKWVSFMHSCWGLASAIGPMLMSAAIVYTSSYKNGFKMVLALIVLAIIILLILKMKWAKKKQFIDKEVVDLHSVTEEEKNSDISVMDVVKQKGVIGMLACFTLANGACCAVVAWLATIVVTQKGVTVVEGATAVTAFSFALMLGRIGIGFAVKKIGIQKSIKTLSLLVFVFVLALFIPYKSAYIVYINAALIGFMVGPITPLLNSNLKELFDNKILGELLSLGSMCSLFGVSAISILMTIASKIISKNYIQIIPAIAFFILFLTYSNVVSGLKQNR